MSKTLENRKVKRKYKIKSIDNILIIKNKLKQNIQLKD